MRTVNPFEIFSNKNNAIDDIETKSYGSSYGYGSGLSFPEYLFNSGHEDLSAFASILLYKKVMPFFNAVSMRAESFSQIPIRVRDKRTKDLVDDHPSLELLERPNADVSKEEFLEQVSSFYDITGESFIVATGRVNRPPLELVASNSPHLYDFSPEPSRFGILNVPNEIYLTRFDSGRLSFFADEYKTLGLRYVQRDQSSEVWHIRSFNPLRSSNNFRGLSKAQPIWLELQQYLSGNTSNLSNLKRGTRLSMAWVNNRSEELTQTQWDRMQEEAQKYSGDVNAGGTPVLDGMDVKTIQQTNRDMEFQKLQESMLARVSSIYKIPLALLLPTTMTLDNLKTSMLQFFDNSTLPLTTRIHSELSRMVLPRYPGSEKLEYCYSQNDISALRTRILEEGKLLKDIDVNTIDELRNTIGDSPLPPGQGGDNIYRGANLIPINEDFGLNDDELTTDDF